MRKQLLGRHRVSCCPPEAQLTELQIACIIRDISVYFGIYIASFQRPTGHRAKTIHPTNGLPHSCATFHLALGRPRYVVYLLRLERLAPDTPSTAERLLACARRAGGSRRRPSLRRAPRARLVSSSSAVAATTSRYRSRSRRAARASASFVWRATARDGAGGRPSAAAARRCAAGRGARTAGGRTPPPRHPCPSRVAWSAGLAGRTMSK